MCFFSPPHLPQQYKLRLFKAPPPGSPFPPFSPLVARLFRTRRPVAPPRRGPPASLVARRLPTCPWKLKKNEVRLWRENYRLDAAGTCRVDTETRRNGSRGDRVAHWTRSQPPRTRSPPRKTWRRHVRTGRKRLARERGTGVGTVGTRYLAWRIPFPPGGKV